MGQRNSLAARLSDPRDAAAAWRLAAALLVAEALLCGFIIWRVPYTEIDWEAYMQEVGGYMQVKRLGERDYTKLRGGTGPLVYPAGFVYIFSALRWATGGAVLPAQVVFAALYLATQAVVMALYIGAKSMPPWALVLLCLSRRLHSIYVLRLFNDCWAMFLAYAGVLALQHACWTTAVLVLSAAVSIKMNVLLMAPGVLAAFFKAADTQQLLRAVGAGAALQVVLGAPFLLAFPKSYVVRAFEFSRVFMFQWTVNWKFLPEAWFTSRQLAVFLLAAHLRLLWSLAQRVWFSSDGGVCGALAKFWQRSTATRSTTARPTRLSQDDVLHIVFTANFVGILCARTLHYQFYSWYWHTLPYLLVRSKLPYGLSIVLLLSVEGIWNVYPPTPLTSALLLVLHALVAMTCFQSHWQGTHPRSKAIRRRSQRGAH